MPAAVTSGEDVLEAFVAGPDQANRLFTVTGTALVDIRASGEQKTETFTFQVGPTLMRGQFHRAIAVASVSSQTVGTATGRQPAPPTFIVRINSVQAGWDPESERVVVRVQVLLSVSASGMVHIEGLHYWVTILAQI